ncbi:MAG: NHL domain-containing thioredoxin family protein, partial [Planctomycetaceae bacterium]
AIVRHEIEHPVVNDANMTLWRKFGTRSWPTLAIMDPEGHYLGSQPGEGSADLFDDIIQRLIRYHKANGTLDTTPIRFDLERTKLPPMPLKFPGKILADADSQRLFISDSNHNRIVIADLNGKLIDVVGTGQIGAKNGGYDTATFDHPQGLSLLNETLYVADTENHLIRTIDLKKRSVTTLAGTGKQDRRRTSGGKLKTTALNSPWALQIVGDRLYIAMAGPHQLWSHKLNSTVISVFAGSGREDVTNGSRKASAFAQPSGLATDGSALFVVDSEGSSVRSVPFSTKTPITTLVGTSELPNGQSLFAFGDQDGVGNAVRLQHPLGVAYRAGQLFIADTYNHKIKRIDLESNRCQTWLGTGKSGSKLKPVELSEPAGLSIAGDTLYIADTNNHRICRANVKTAEVTVLTIDGLTPPASAKPAPTFDASTPSIKLPPITMAAKQQIPVQVKFQLPEGFKLNKQAPTTYQVRVLDGPGLLAPQATAGQQQATRTGEVVHFNLPLAKSAGQSTIDLQVTYVYCRGGVGGLCKFSTARWTVPIRIAGDAKLTGLTLTAQADKVAIGSATP